MKRQVLAGALVAGVSVLSVFAAADAGVWLDVPFVHQAPEGCGAACIAMVMNYWAKQDAGASDAADAAKIQALLFDREAGGIKASDMERYFQQKGFNAYAFDGPWSELERHLRQGRPVIVCLREGGLWAHTLHYAVVVGFDGSRNVLLNDPASRKLSKLDRLNFEKRWRACDHWTLLALPRQER